jgi:hypothetical protein
MHSGTLRTRNGWRSWREGLSCTTHAYVRGNTGTDLKAAGYEGVTWIYLAKDRDQQ